MKSTHAFDILDMPQDPYEAEKFILDQVRAVFGRAHEADMTKAVNFAAVRMAHDLDPLNTHMKMVLVFKGDEKKIFDHTTGEVS